MRGTPAFPKIFQEDEVKNCPYRWTSKNKKIQNSVPPDAVFGVQKALKYVCSHPRPSKWITGNLLLRGGEWKSGKGIPPKFTTTPMDRNNCNELLAYTPAFNRSVNHSNQRITLQLTTELLWRWFYQHKQVQTMKSENNFPNSQVLRCGQKVKNYCQQLQHQLFSIFWLQLWSHISSDNKENMQKYISLFMHSSSTNNHVQVTI